MHKQPLQTPTLKQLRMKTVHTLVYIPTVKKTCAYANTLITQHTPTIKKKSIFFDCFGRTCVHTGGDLMHTLSLSHKHTHTHTRTCARTHAYAHSDDFDPDVWRRQQKKMMKAQVSCSLLHCNALQHAATHCIALQHAATHCNTM